MRALVARLDHHLDDNDDDNDVPTTTTAFCNRRPSKRDTHLDLSRCRNICGAKDGINVYEADYPSASSTTSVQAIAATRRALRFGALDFLLFRAVSIYLNRFDGAVGLLDCHTLLQNFFDNV